MVPIPQGTSASPRRHCEGLPLHWKIIMNVDFLSRLPAELLLEVLEHLPSAHDLAAVRQVNHVFNRMVSGYENQLAAKLTRAHQSCLEADLRLLDCNDIDLQTAIRHYVQVFGPVFDFVDDMECRIALAFCFYRHQPVEECFEDTAELVWALYTLHRYHHIPRSLPLLTSMFASDNPRHLHTLFGTQIGFAQFAATDCGVTAYTVEQIAHIYNAVTKDKIFGIPTAAQIREAASDNRPQVFGHWDQSADKTLHHLAVAKTGGVHASGFVSSDAEFRLCLRSMEGPVARFAETLIPTEDVSALAFAALLEETVICHPT
ncbi:hypothetical protein LTR85_006669 [Meristemomyces frigidus]|nr:hypothetical protein LTR85_006669 [Meristemomyces frigidus]